MDEEDIYELQIQSFNFHILKSYGDMEQDMFYFRVSNFDYLICLFYYKEKRENIIQSWYIFEGSQFVLAMLLKLIVQVFKHK
jgi:hypothetical protein